jgi:hypothetical protein
MWHDLMRGRMDEQDNQNYRAFVDECVAETAVE